MVSEMNDTFVVVVDWLREPPVNLVQAVKVIHILDGSASDTVGIGTNNINPQLLKKFTT